MKQDTENKAAEAVRSSDWLDRFMERNPNMPVRGLFWLCAFMFVILGIKLWLFFSGGAK